MAPSSPSVAVVAHLAHAEPHISPIMQLIRMNEASTRTIEPYQLRRKKPKELPTIPSLSDTKEPSQLAGISPAAGSSSYDSGTAPSIDVSSLVQLLPTIPYSGELKYSSRTEEVPLSFPVSTETLTSTTSAQIEREDQEIRENVHPILRTEPTVHPLLAPMSSCQDSVTKSRLRHTRRPTQIAVQLPGEHRPPQHRRSNTTSTISTEIRASTVADTILEALQQKLTSHLRKYGEASRKTASAHNMIGNHHFRQKSFEPALASYRKALRCFELLSAKRNSASMDILVAIATTLGNIGTVCWRTGKINDAVEALEEAVFMIDQDSEGDSAEVANLCYTLGMAKSLSNDFQGAIECFAKMKRILLSQSNPSNVEIARAVDAMGKVRLRQGDAASAIRMHLDALRLKRKALGQRNTSVVQTELNLAAAYQSHGAPEDALSVLKGAQSTRKILMRREEDRERRRALAADLSDTMRVITELTREIAQKQGSGSSMLMIEEEKEIMM